MKSVFLICLSVEELDAINEITNNKRRPFLKPYTVILRKFAFPLCKILSILKFATTLMTQLTVMFHPSSIFHIKFISIEEFKHD